MYRSDISIIHINKWHMHIVFVYIYYIVSIVLYPFTQVNVSCFEGHAVLNVLL